METPTRLTAQDIVKAFDKTGLKPMRGGFYDHWSDGTKCACAITALITASLNNPEYAKQVETLTRKEMGLKIGGLSPEEVQAIILGFDGAGISHQGYEYYYDIALEASRILERDRGLAIFIEEEDYFD